MQPFDQSRRARVGGGGNGRLGLAAVLLGAGLLILMVTIGTIDAPPPPTATPLLVAPGPSPAATPAAAPTPAPWAPEFLYLIRRSPTADPSASQRILEVIEAASGQTVYTLDGVADATLSADGRTVYLLGEAEVIALSAVTPGERWRTPLPELSRYAIEREDGSRLALSADGRTLLVLRQRIDGRLGRRLAWIERYRSDSGAAAGPRIDVDPIAWNPLLIGGDDNTALVVAATVFSSIDLGDGVAATLMEPASGPFVAALLPRQNQIYAANGEGVLTRMSRYDPSRDRRSMVLSADVRPSFGVDSMAVSPNGELVALVLERPGPPVVHAGLLTHDGSSIRLSAIDPNTGTIRRQAELPDDSWITHLAFSADGTLVYFVANTRLHRWHLESNAVSEIASVNGVERLVVGPAWRDLPPDLAPSATPAATATPRPLPPALTRPATETVAWLWPMRNAESNRDVVAYAADGSARLVAGSVDTAVSRPGQMPLLLRATGQREWQIIDPSAQTTATVRFDAQPRPLLYRDGGFLPSPDGSMLAFLATDDLIATDALTDASQIVLVDVRTGELRALAGLDRLEERLDWHNAQWAAGGIYVFSQTPAAATVRSATALWRIDPAAAPALERLLRFATPGAYASLNAAAGLVLYQGYTDDPMAGSLRLADLNGGDEIVVMERGPFINSHEASISPDGRYVAYLRPAANLNVFDLVLYDIAARRERRLGDPQGGGMRRFRTGDLMWSGQSSLHLLRYEPQDWLGVAAADVWELGDLVPTRPQRRFAAAPSWLAGSGSDAGWLERRRFASLEALGEYALLRRISLDPAPSVELALPLPAGPDALVTGDTGVIYEP